MNKIQVVEYYLDKSGGYVLAESKSGDVVVSFKDAKEAMRLMYKLKRVRLLDLNGKTINSWVIKSSTIKGYKEWLLSIGGGEEAEFGLELLGNPKFRTHIYNKRNTHTIDIFFTSPETTARLPYIVLVKMFKELKEQKH